MKVYAEGSRKVSEGRHLSRDLKGEVKPGRFLGKSILGRKNSRS